MTWQLTDVGTSEKLLGVWCGPEEVIAVGTGGVIVRCRDGMWKREASGTTENLYAIAGNNEDVIIVGGNLHVGGSSLIVHRQSERWISEPSGMQHILLSVCASPYGWIACGYNGAIVRGGPGDWQREDVAHYQHAFAATASGGHAVVAGLSGSVVSYDGNVWTPQSTPVDGHLRALAAGSRDHVIGVGLEGVIVRFDGRCWSLMDSPVNAHLEGVWLDESDHGYAVGSAGTLLEYDGRKWRQRAPITDHDLHAVHGDRRRVIAVGVSGTACVLER